jgi:hypothetical protein
MEDKMQMTVAQSKYYLGTCLDGLRITTKKKNWTVNSHDLNQVSHNTRENFCVSSYMKSNISETLSASIIREWCTK